MAKRARKLGSTQTDVLCSLVEYGGWEQNCGWVWTTQHETEKFLMRLVELGYAKTIRRRTERGTKLAYRATARGEAYARRVGRP